jgi:O-antigen ligase
MAALAVFALVNLQALQESQQLSVVTERVASLGRAQVVRSDYRYEIYRTTPSIIESHPWLGVGAGNYSVAAKRYALLDQNDLPFDHAHNVPLTVAAELGVVGLLAFLWLAVALARLVVRAVRARGDPRHGHLVLGLAATMAGVAVISLGDYPPRTNAIAATFVVLIGALAALLASHERSGRPGAMPRPPSAPR